MKKLRSVLLLLFLILSISVCNVNAEEKIRQITVEDKNYYYYSDSNSTNYGNYYGETKGNNATLYTKEKNIHGNEAFCVEASNLAPKNGASYSEVFFGQTVNGKTWNETDALITGCIIKTVYDASYAKVPTGDYIVTTYATLNTHLGFSRSVNFSKNPKIKGYLDSAISAYNKLNTSSSLPSFSAKAKSVVMDRHGTGNNVYYVGEFTLSKLIKNYGGDHIHAGGDVVTYTLTLPNGVSLCEDKSCKKTNTKLVYSGVSGDMVFYVKATGVNPGDDLKINIKATNKSDYYIGRLWKPVSGNTQLLLGKGYKTYSRSKSTSVNFTIPDFEKKVIKLVKKDSVTGEYLTGANIKLQLSGGATNSCDISGNNFSCSITITDNTSKDVYYSVVETSSPEGYIKGQNIPATKWDLNSSSSTCYISNGTNFSTTSMEDCERNYQLGKVCNINGNVTVGECQVSTDDTGQIVTNGVESTICYYESNGVKEVDASKCDSQNTYTKITNSGGNLVVEYPNTKNHIEISKVDVTGDKELVGAELKICSNKPNSDGSCNVVRNTLDGQCDVVTDDSVISSDKNCVSNNDGTKTVDMQWISGMSSKIWNGLKPGTYYLVETISPSGYLPLSTSLEFKIDSTGRVTSSAYDETKNKIVVKNKITDFIIGKRNKENKKLAGAELGICAARKNKDGKYELDVNEDGYCVPIVLATGETAKWISGNNDKKIQGLVIGTYYLVEFKAPEKYNVAEPILFTLKNDGTIVDKDGKSLKDNLLLMYDDPLSSSKTGDLPVLSIILIGVLSIAICGGSYYCLVVKDGLGSIMSNFKKKK